MAKSKKKPKLIDQKLLWLEKYPNVSVSPSDAVSSFAVRSCNRMKKEGLKSVLELGCGFGFDSLYFAKRGLNVTAIDFSPVRINYLKRLKEDNQISGNLVCRIKDVTKPWSKGSYEPGSIDAVFANKSLHYFNHAATHNILGNVYNVLKKNGLFFACVHSAFHNFADKGTELEKGLYVWNTKIRRFFTRYCFRKYLDGYFEVLSLNYSKENKKEDQSFLEGIARKAK